MADSKPKRKTLKPRVPSDAPVTENKKPVKKPAQQEDSKDAG